jgi:hypothetical protein
MFAFIEKYVIYLLVILIVLIGIVAGYQMLKNAKLQTTIVKCQDQVTILNNANIGLTANKDACAKNLVNVQTQNANSNDIQKKKDAIENIINNYKPPTSTVTTKPITNTPTVVSNEKGDSENAKKIQLTIAANLIVNNFNSRVLSH